MIKSRFRTSAHVKLCYLYPRDTERDGNAYRKQERAWFCLGYSSLFLVVFKDVSTAYSPRTLPRTIQQVSVKLLNGTVIKVPAEPADSVQTLKERVEAANSELTVG